MLASEINQSMQRSSKTEICLFSTVHYVSFHIAMFIFGSNNIDSSAAVQVGVQVERGRVKALLCLGPLPNASLFVRAVSKFVIQCTNFVNFITPRYSNCKTEP